MQKRPLKLFIIYSREDALYRDELYLHINSLVRKGLVEKWDDTHLLPGEDWEKRIMQELETSDLVIVLVSANFLFSDFIQTKELKAALQQQNKGITRIVPILLRDCLWEEEPSLASLQMLPRKHSGGVMPVISPVWGDSHAAWASVCRDLLKLVADIQAKTASVTKTTIVYKDPDANPNAERTDGKSPNSFDIKSRQKDASAWATALEDFELWDSPDDKIAAIEGYLETENIPRLHTEDALELINQVKKEASKHKIAERRNKQKEDRLVSIKSPMVGTFYRSNSPDKPPLVKIGDQIDRGAVVCIIEAMKLFNEIESEIKGEIVKVLVEDACPVEFDQPLFLIEPH